MPIVSLSTRRTLPTFALLDEIVTILGGTKMGFWPFLNGVGGGTYPYGSGNDGIVLATNASTIEDIFDPFRLAAGLHAYMNDSATANLAAADNTAFSHGNGTVDTPFSAGIWILVQEALGTARSLMAKYGSTAAAKEYDFRFGTDGKLVMELLDESVVGDASEIATSTGTALTPWVWQFCTMTYDGGETAPVINLYLNATSVHDGSSVETNAYVAMEDLGASLMVGARDAPGTAAQVFQGRMALPFITGKELTAAEVNTLYSIGRRLLGLTD